MYSIYKLSSCETDNVYIGITKTKLSHRLAKHKNHYKRYTNNNGHWISAYHISKYLDVKIELVEETDDKTRERFHIENTENCINEKIPTRTQKEYHQENKQKRNEYSKQYAKNHKEQIAGYKKKHYEEKAGIDVLCECGRTYKKKHEKRHKSSKIHLDLINDVKKETPEERKARYNANRRAKYKSKQ